MRVLLAPDGFTGTLTAAEAARAMATGWRAARPDDDLDLCPLSDGGPDFVEVLHAATGGSLLPVATTGPLGAPLTAPVLLVEEGGARPRTTAYVESALACGSALVPPAERDPVAASTAGVGLLLAAALDAGAERVVVGLGGSCTTDGGAGALLALGAGEDLAQLPALRARWADVELVLASDVDVPLTGPRGAAAGFGPQKGATPAQVEQLEARLVAWAERAREVLAGAPPAGGAAPADGSGLRHGAGALHEEPGAGAAGGLGFGLLLLGARRGGGAEVVADAVGLDARIAAADLVLTGEGSLDWQSLRGKVVARVAGRAAAAGVPVVAVAGQVRLTPEEVTAAGLRAAVAVAERPEDVPAALADPAATLAARVERWASTLRTPA